MNKEEIISLIESELAKNPELLQIIKEEHAILYGDYLATIVFNKLFNTNKELPKPILLINSNSYISLEIIDKDTYTLFNAFTIRSNYESASFTINYYCISYTWLPNQNNYVCFIDDAFLELINTKQIHFHTPINAGLMLYDAKIISDKWEGYLYVDLGMLSKVAYDISTLSNLNCLALNEDKAKILGFKYKKITTAEGIEYCVVNVPEKGLLTGSLYKGTYQLKGSLIDVYIRFFNLFYGYGVKKSLRQLREEFIPYNYLRNFLLNNPNYLVVLPNRWKAKLKKLDNFISDHTGLTPLFIKLNLAEQIALYEDINNVAEKHGLWTIGLLEQKDNYPVYNKDKWIAEISLKKLEHSKWLVKPLKLPLLPYGLNATWKIVELNTRQLLIEEGEYQHHCVGGYAVSDDHRIFSIRQGDFRYTIEMRFFTYGIAWEIVQEQGKYRERLDNFPEKIQRDLGVITSWLITDLPHPNHPKFHPSI